MKLKNKIGRLTLLTNILHKSKLPIRSRLHSLSITTYQTMLYKVILDLEYGWDYSGDILFESSIYKSPTDAMLELSFCEPSHNNWFATMRMIKNGNIVEEQIFDSSVIEID